MPVPERLTLCGLLAAASEIVNDPVRVPVALGVNSTPTTQFAPGPRSVPLHPSLERLKSPAEAITLLICSEKLFGLVRVTSLAVEVVPTSCLAKVSEAGLMVTFAVAVGVGVAVSVAAAVAVSVAVAVATAVAIAVSVGVDVALGSSVGVAVGVSLGVAVGVGTRKLATSVSPFSSISAEFLPDGEGSPTFKSMAASSVPKGPHPYATGTAKVLSATSTPVTRSAFPALPSTGALVVVSCRFNTIGSASEPM